MQTTEQDRETDALDAFRLEDYLSLPDPFAAFLGADLDKAVLGQAITTGSGGNVSNSIADAHGAARRDVIAANVRAICGM